MSVCLELFPRRCFAPSRQAVGARRALPPHHTRVSRYKDRQTVARVVIEARDRCRDLPRCRLQRRFDHRQAARAHCKRRSVVGDVIGRIALSRMVDVASIVLSHAVFISAEVENFISGQQGSMNREDFGVRNRNIPRQ